MIPGCQRHWVLNEMYARKTSKGARLESDAEVSAWSYRTFWQTVPQHRCSVGEGHNNAAGCRTERLLTTWTSQSSSLWVVSEILLLRCLTISIHRQLDLSLLARNEVDDFVLSYLRSDCVAKRKIVGTALPCFALTSGIVTLHAWLPELVFVRSLAIRKDRRKKIL